MSKWGHSSLSGASTRQTPDRRLLTSVVHNSSIAHLAGHILPTLNLLDTMDVILRVAGLAAALDRVLQLRHNKWIDG
ncbi:hypothetical protein RL72_00943 [Microbacterium azadirachtae]|uniref:Uncharacterized protein n=1 Tax=Microbacterium azadirachtae TaxID=582680 RepID=A0A0F0L4Z1_9MICO|nr:hypothetical protein RL72_00943 [Microbacterium azadirachtae]